MLSYHGLSLKFQITFYYKIHSMVTVYRDVNIFIFLKTIVSLRKRRRKIEKETIVFLKSSIFKNGRF